MDVFVWLRINRVSRATAAFGSVLFLAAFAAYAPAYIAMNDPQLLAHAFMMTSAVVLWRFEFSRKALRRRRRFDGSGGDASSIC